MPTTCPKCGAALKYTDCGPVYECGSWDRTTPERLAAFHQKDKCRIREQDAEIERLRSSHKDLHGALRLYREAVQANGCPNDESTYGWLKDKLAELAALRSRKCEGCGTRGDNVTYIKVRVTNGSLMLCQQCLDDVNRKNPELTALRERLAGLAERWKHQDAGGFSPIRGVIFAQCAAELESMEGK
jgi:DNA-directed RNA polymerase subunit M/transcription elongation factor TFIIS